MRVQLGSVLTAAVFGVGLLAGSASAQNVDWATCGPTPPACSATQTSCCTESAANLNFGQPSGDKAIIIPMDRCHQPISSPATFGAPAIAAPAWCANSPAGTANGMMFAYGLIYRLMQTGVPVYWIVNPTKHASGPMFGNSIPNQVYYEDDIDMWILHSSQTSANIPSIAAVAPSSNVLTSCLPSPAVPACSAPVSRLNSSLGVASVYQYKEFPLRGTVFLIPGLDTDGDTVSDRVEFNNFWNAYGKYPSASAGASGVKCGVSNNDCYDFTQVALYEVNTTAIPAWKDYITSTAYTSLPVGVKLNYKPPRIARVNSSGNVSNQFLFEANLKDTASSTCTQGTNVRSTLFAGAATGALPYEPVVCDLSETDLLNNSLVTGNFGWAWLDGGSFTSCRKSMQSIYTYLTGVPGVTTPGNVMVNDSSITDVETCLNHQLLGRQGTAYSSAGSGSGALDIQNGVNEADNQPFLIRYPTNLFAQYGDVPMDFASSSVGYWTSGSSWGYNTIYTGSSNTLKRLLTREATRTAGTNEICGDNETPTPNGTLVSGGTPNAGDKPHWYDVYPHNNATGCDKTGDNTDTATYARFGNDMLNGIVFYLPGNQLSNNGRRGELRMLLNSLLATPSGAYTPSCTSPPCQSYEVSRSNPIAPLINAVEYIVQGTYVVQSPSGTAPQVNGDADISNFYFPFRIGHMRARPAPPSTATPLLDAGCNSTLAGFACPAGSVGIPATRTIFTNTAGGDLRGVSSAKVTFDTTLTTSMKNLLSLGASLSPTTINTLISRVRQGYPSGTPGTYISALGGVDRSTTAVIQASGVAGNPSRPMMIYFGAADGMLHAVCAETNVSFGCTSPGLERWAFLPRKMLPYIRLNTARIDGSPRVLDAYIDPDGAGTTYTTSWRTVLVFQTGMGDYTIAGREPAVYALDITDPANPLLLWEFTNTQATMDTNGYALGVGLSMSAGPTTVTIAGSPVTKYFAWADTNNLGPSGPGSVVTAIDLASGAGGAGLLPWRQAYFQFSPNPRTAANDAVARSGEPTGTVPLDLPSGAGAKITHLLFNDIYGRTWLINPDTLVSTNGAGVPLFAQTNDYYAMGAKPAVYTTGGAQYAVFATGGYADPSNTTWPLECCSSANGTSCDGTQLPVCSQYNNSTAKFPMQMLVAVKIDTAATATATPPAVCDTSALNDPVSGALPNCPAVTTSAKFLFRRDLGRDEKSSTQVLVVGTDLFLTTDSENVNRALYGTSGANTGHLYKFDSITGSQTGTSATPSTSIVMGAGAATASNITTAGSRGVYAGAGGSFGTGASTTSGSNVTSKGAIGPTRKAWLRTE